MIDVYVFRGLGWLIGLALLSGAFTTYKDGRSDGWTQSLGAVILAYWLYSMWRLYRRSVGSAASPRGDAASIASMANLRRTANLPGWPSSGDSKSILTAPPTKVARRASAPRRMISLRTLWDDDPVVLVVSPSRMSMRIHFPLDGRTTTVDLKGADRPAVVGEILDWCGVLFTLDPGQEKAVDQLISQFDSKVATQVEPDRSQIETDGSVAGLVASASSSESSTKSVLEDLERLAKLHRDGHLTSDEFTTLKSRLLTDN